MSAAPVTLDFSKSQPIDVANLPKAQPVTLDFSQAQSIVPGEQINDVGNKVITPIEGESFASTLQRAAAYGRSITQQPDKGASVINKEMATAPKKAATVLAAAPAIGAGLPVAMAAVGEGVAGLGPAAIKGAQAVSDWVNKSRINQLMAYIIYHELKKHLSGTVGFIKNLPDIPDE